MTQPQRRSIFDVKPGFRRQHVWSMGLWLLAITLILVFVLPTDLNTTAIWWANQQMPTPWADVASAGKVYEALVSVLPTKSPVEAVVFSYMITVLAFLFNYKVYEAGPWIVGGDEDERDSPGMFVVFWRVLKHIVGRPGIRPEQLNTGKMAWMAVWLLAILFDTYTGVSYRMAQRAAELGVSVSALPAGYKFTVVVGIGLIYENIASEIALGECVRGAISTIIAFALTFPAVVRFLNEWRGELEGARNVRPPRREEQRRPEPPRQRAPEQQRQRRMGQPSEAAAHQRGDGMSRGNGGRTPLYVADQPQLAEMLLDLEEVS